ncbi:MAG: hypothetical protein ACRD03_03490, partial [Acidimicrobiales bacterium]
APITAAPVTTAAPQGPSSPPLPAAQPGGSQPVVGPEVRLSANGSWELADPGRVVDGLAPATVLRLTAVGFRPDTSGDVSQCTGAGRRGGCRGRFPVRFDGAGTARFQYLVSSAGLPDGCDPGRECLLVVRGDGSSSALVPLVFGARVPPAGSVTISPGGKLDSGQAVRVSVAGMRPGERLRAVQCARPALPVAERCGPPGPAAPLVVGDDGQGSATLAVVGGDVAAGRYSCRRGADCAVAVVGDRGLVRAPVVPIAFSTGPGARYDGGRLAAGLLAAAALLGLATWLVRTTDWSAPTEASTPAMDAAELDGPLRPA